MLVFEFNPASNSWILVSETKVSFYDHLDVTYFDSALAPRQAPRSDTCDD